MIQKLLIVSGIVMSVTCTVIHQLPIFGQNDNPIYNFAYEVYHPPTGDIKNAHESRRGDTVIGQYSLIQPDGIRRIVDYTADNVRGFRTTVINRPVIDRNDDNRQYGIDKNDNEINDNQDSKLQTQSRQNVEQTAWTNHSPWPSQWADSQNQWTNSQNQRPNQQNQWPSSNQNTQRNIPNRDSKLQIQSGQNVEQTAWPNQSPWPSQWSDSQNQWNNSQNQQPNQQNQWPSNNQNTQRDITKAPSVAVSRTSLVQTIESHPLPQNTNNIQNRQN